MSLSLNNLDTPEPISIPLWNVGVDFDALCDEALGTARGVFTVSLDGERENSAKIDLGGNHTQKSAEALILVAALGWISELGLNHQTHLILSCDSRPMVAYLSDFQARPLPGTPLNLEKLQKMLCGILVGFGRVTAYYRPKEARSLTFS